MTYRLHWTEKGKLPIGSDTQVPEGGQAVDLVTTTSDVRWTWGFEQRSAAGDTELVLRLPDRSVAAGTSRRQALNTAVFGPSTSDRTLTRNGGTIGVSIPMFTDSNGGQGSSPSAPGRVTLFRDGVKFGETTNHRLRLQDHGLTISQPASAVNSIPCPR